MDGPDEISTKMHEPGTILINYTVQLIGCNKTTV